MCPTLASTSKSGPRYSAIVRALRGDSTMTRRLPDAALLVATGSPFLTLNSTLVGRRPAIARRPLSYFLPSASRPQRRKDPAQHGSPLPILAPGYHISAAR